MYRLPKPSRLPILKEPFGNEMVPFKCPPPKTPITSFGSKASMGMFIFGIQPEMKKSPVQTSLKTNNLRFAIIHKKMFEKMESIDEVVNRRMERYFELTQAKDNGDEADLKEIRCTDPAQSVKAENRLSRHKQLFKGRTLTSSGKRSGFLKNVRLNRRFDLQMKFRYENMP